MEPLCEIKGAMEHNLKNIDVQFPLKTLLSLQSVSGSVNLHWSEYSLSALNRKINQYGEKPGFSGSLKSIGDRKHRLRRCLITSPLIQIGNLSG